ncbi:MAG: hypothetical protein ACRCUY_09525 [Thermoguttaceae bacterium]
MRISLQTLLAFEDKVFDLEQHRQLERIITKQSEATATLARLRKVTRDFRLGVPGCENRNEELDPNFVAEYLDHQMDDQTQKEFETYCLESDIYLAEIASIHQILANVLGEPARTSRECRLLCYALEQDKSSPESIPNHSKTDRHDETENKFGVIGSQHKSNPRFSRDDQSASRPKNTQFESSIIPVAPSGNRFQELKLFLSSNESASSLHEELMPTTLSSTLSSTILPSESSPLNSKQSRQERNEATQTQKLFSWTRWSFWIFAFVICSSPLFIYISEKNAAKKLPLESICQTATVPISTTQISETDTFEIGDFAQTVSAVIPAAIQEHVSKPQKTTAAQHQIEVSTDPLHHPDTQKSFSFEVSGSELTSSESVVPTASVSVTANAAPTETTVHAADHMQTSAAVNAHVKKLEPTIVGEKTLVPNTASTHTSNESMPESLVQSPPDPFAAVFVTTQSHEPHTSANTQENVSGNIVVAPESSTSTPPQLHETIVAFQPISKAPSKTIQRVVTDNQSENPPRLEVKPIISPSEIVDANSMRSWPNTSNILPVTQIRESDTKNQEMASNADANAVDSINNSRMKSANWNVQTEDETNMASSADKSIAWSNATDVIQKSNNTNNQTPASKTAQQESSETTQVSRLGCVPESTEPVMLFSASSASAQWRKEMAPFDLEADQYLLSLAPFRATFELANSFDIEMIGDSKLCILPIDEDGNPGIYVDYGRIVIRPKKTGSDDSIDSIKTLRIETEKIEGLISLQGNQSIFFIDTFAGVTDAQKEIPIANESGVNEMGLSSLKTESIIGFLPATNEAIYWASAGMSEPLLVSKNSTALLSPDCFLLGELQHEPNWLKNSIPTVEQTSLAQTCQRIFNETNGNCEEALQQLTRNRSIAVRGFGFRLWGDLGRFDVPLKLLSKATNDDEPIRKILVPYFREVMKRDEETVQRLSESIQMVRK